MIPQSQILALMVPKQSLPASALESQSQSCLGPLNLSCQSGLLFKGTVLECGGPGPVPPFSRKLGIVPRSLTRRCFHTSSVTPRLLLPLSKLGPSAKAFLIWARPRTAAAHWLGTSRAILSTKGRRETSRAASRADGRGKE